MGTAEGFLHLLSGPTLWHPTLQSDFVLKPHLSYSACTKRLKGLRGKRNLWEMDGYYRRINYVNVPPRRSCNVNCLSSDGLNGPLFSGEGDKLKPNLADINAIPHASEFISSEKLAAASAKSEKVLRVKADSLEDEAWELLRESIVYYCGTPVGTIAANDPTSTSILNYDHVFIRDFVPSAIAFLLKGEFEIVRNFILHTLQLQVCMVFLPLY